MEKNYLDNLKRIRTEKDISQKDMAEKLGFAQNNYSKIERGLVELSVSRLYEIADILEVSVLKILGEDDDAQKSIIQNYIIKIEELEKEVLLQRIMKNMVTYLTRRINGKEHDNMEDYDNAEWRKFDKSDLEVLDNNLKSSFADFFDGTIFPNLSEDDKNRIEQKKTKTKEEREKITKDRFESYKK